MNVLTAVAHEVLGLFVDDGSLALAILAVVVLAAVAAAILPSVPLLAGAILLLGCLGVLLANLATVVRQR